MCLRKSLIKVLLVPFATPGLEETLEFCLQRIIASGQLSAMLQNEQKMARRKRVMYRIPPQTARADEENHPWYVRMVH